MKTKIAILLTAFTLAVRAQISIPDTTTPHTVLQTNTYYATITGFFTNEPLTVWRSTVSYGDSLAVAFGKLSDDVLYLQTNAVAGTNNTPTLTVFFATNNAVVTGTNVWGEFTNSTAFITTGSITNLMSFDGTNYQGYQPTNVITATILTNTWVNYFGTNSVTNATIWTNYAVAPLWLASSGAGATSSVTIYGYR